jgi:hypothetical protein
MGHTSAFSVAYFTQVRCGAFSSVVAVRCALSARDRKKEKR